MTTARLNPLIEPPPALDAVTAQELLARHWGRSGELTPLHGERDLNFRVTEADGQQFVLKIHNPADSAGIVAFQTAALRHIRQVAPQLPVGDLVPTHSGDAWAVTADNAGRTCHTRLLTHLDGHHPDRDDLSAHDLFAWGRMVAFVGRALRGFFHPEAGYPIAWDIRRIASVREWAAALDDERRAAVVAVIDRHADHVAPVLQTVRAQVVHNDLSRDNVLVDAANLITGITDFGDMTHTSLVCDLAVAIADVLDGRPDSLDLAEPIIAGYVAVTPLETIEADLLADLVAGRCAAALAIQAWRLASHDTAPQPGGGAWQLLQQIHAVGIDDVAARFATAAAAAEPRPRNTAALAAARDRSFGPLSLSYSHPVHLVRGAGVELYDASGRSYLDAYNNVPVLGHSHPAFSAAVAAQLRRLNTNSRYLQDAPVELAERLLATMPGERLDRLLLVNSGSEANDLAWRIACHVTGAAGGIVTDFAYHGVTTATAWLSPEGWPAGDRPAHIREVEPPHAPANGREPARTVTTAAAELAGEGIGLAAMFVDGVFTSDGILGPAADWTREAVAAVHAAGGLYVADEVQAGHGRTGESLWSFAAHGLAADLVTLGKPMGNGYPVAAVVGPAELIDPFMAATDYFSTFGGGTAACVAALTVLRVIDDEGLIDNARTVGGQLAALLRELADQHPALAAPRHWGLAVGVDVRSAATGEPDPGLAGQIVDQMRERGVLIGLTGRDEATLKIRPPLVFTTHHAERLVSDLASAIADVVSG